MASSRVHVDLRFREYGERLDRAVRESLAETGNRVERTAAHLAAPRGGLERTVFRTPVQRTRRGWSLSVVSAFPGLYQERGTEKKLGAKRSTRGRKTKGAGHRGVKPLRFLLHGLQAHRGDLVDSLRRRLS
jgi:hypothetical protein